MLSDNSEGFEWIARLDIWRPDFSERLPFEEWALNKLITHRRPLKQVIGLYAGASPLVVELRGTCIWEDPEKQEGLIAALAIVVDQTQWFAKEKAMQATQFKQGMFLSNISRELRAYVYALSGWDMYRWVLICIQAGGWDYWSSGVALRRREELRSRAAHVYPANPWIREYVVSVLPFPSSRAA